MFSWKSKALFTVYFTNECFVLRYHTAKAFRIQPDYPLTGLGIGFYIDIFGLVTKTYCWGLKERFISYDLFFFPLKNREEDREERDGRC